jgi:phenylacetate-coenzyme A ligase PaaK-like adenylate-forming protein
MSSIKEIANKSPFYNKPAYLDSLTIQDMPIIDRETVIQNYNDIFCATNNTRFFETSGSSGIPLKIGWVQNDYLKSMIPLWKLRNQYGIKPTDFFLTCHATIRRQTEILTDPVIINKNSMSLSKLQYTNEILSYYTEQIRVFRPKWIYAQPSFVYFMGSYLHNYAPDVAQEFSYVELVGELLIPSIEESIKNFFPNASIVNMYGLQEFNGVLYGKSEIMFPVSDEIIIEILNENGGACEDEEEGEIVLTSISNSCFPLIRYNTHDRGKKIHLDSLEGYIITSGRSNDIFVYEKVHYDGSIFFTIIDDYNRSNSEKISKFQAVLEDNTLTFNLFSMDVLPPRQMLEEKLRSIISNYIPIKSDLSVRVTESKFIKTGSNKIKYFINKT